MAFYTSGQNKIDPITGLPVIGGSILTAQSGAYLVPQATGESPSGINTLPGTFTPLPPGQSVTLPYGFISIPSTGPLS